MKVIVVGGVATGMSAASKFRREERDSQITVYEKSGEVSYGACGLPFFISGENHDADLMRIKLPEEFETEMNINVKLFHEVEEVDVLKKSVRVKNVITDETFFDTYDKLVIATGASPKVLDVSGKELANIYTLKTIQDGEKIKHEINKDEIEEVVIIGSGFIGLEMAEACIKKNKKVRIIEALPRILSTFEPEITDVIQEELFDSGVAVNVGESVEEFIGKNTVQQVRTASGIYPADMVILAIGVIPNTRFLADQGFEMLKNGAIVVNKRMETSIADVYAGGDCSCVYHKILKNNVYIPLGTNANKQGKIIGQNLAGNNKEFPGALGTSALRINSIEAGKTGITEAEAVNGGISYSTVVVEVNNHAPYYPNPKVIRIKMVYQPETRRILGVSMAGGEGAVLRTNTFAAIIDAELTVDKVSNLDLVYAPPFSQVWDPIHVVVAAVK